jgi:hypothetical protein
VSWTIIPPRRAAVPTVLWPSPPRPVGVETIVQVMQDAAHEGGTY